MVWKCQKNVQCAHIDTKPTKTELNSQREERPWA